MTSLRYQKLVVIYTRYSSDMQRSDSCEIQERAVRQELAKLAVPMLDVRVLRDEAISGTDESRPEYQRLLGWVAEGRVGVLAVYDQSRLSRGRIKGLIEDVVFHGGRFLSIGEHIDTDRPGWDLTVGISEIHHSVSNKDTARRVRSGLENRIRDGHGSNGNFPYGYRSVYREENWAEMLASGRRPKKDVVIDESEAETVREIFRMYADGKMSLNQIARHMRDRSVPLGIRGRKWCHKRIEKILANERYIGRWPWGKTEVVRDSRGKKRQRPVEASRVTIVDRPLLRIIDGDLWDRTRARREEMRVKYGVVGRMKVHPRHAYPTCNLSGLIRCGKCGNRLVLTTNRVTMHKYLLCPAQKHGDCTQRRQLNVNLAEKALFDFLNSVCGQWPEWLALVTSEVNRLVQETSLRVPAELAACEQQIEAIERQIGNLIDKLSSISGSSQSLTDRLTSLETERSALLEDQAKLKGQNRLPRRLPDESFIQAELQRLPDLLATSCPASADLLRRIFRDVRAIEASSLGRKRTHMRLRVQVDPIGFLTSALGPDWQQRLHAITISPVGVVKGDSASFELSVGDQGKYEAAAPVIDQMRSRKIGWEEISEAVAINRQNCIKLLKQYRRDVANAMTR